LLLALPGPRPVGACSCIVGLGEGFLIPEKRTLPANARGLLWWAGGRHVPRNDTKKLNVRFLVQRIDKDKPAEVPFDLEWIRGGLVLVAVNERLRPGSVYRFTGRQGDLPLGPIRMVESDEPVSERSLEVTVSTAKLLPLALAPRLEFGERKKGRLHVQAGGSCSIEINAAQVPVRMVLPPWLEKWKHVLFFRTLVDDKPWEPRGSICTQVPPGRSWVGKGEDLLYAGCPDGDAEPGQVKLVFLGDGGLESGRHTVRMIAELPGTKQRFEARSSFTLSCGG